MTSGPATKNEAIAAMTSERERYEAQVATGLPAYLCSRHGYSDKPCACLLTEHPGPVEEPDDWKGACLGLIREVLEKHLPMEGCPPMFYPEAIHNAIAMPKRAIMRATGADEKTIGTATEDELVEIIAALLRSEPVGEPQDTSLWHHQAEVYRGPLLTPEQAKAVMAGWEAATLPVGPVGEPAAWIVRGTLVQTHVFLNYAEAEAFQRSARMALIGYTANDVSIGSLYAAPPGAPEAQEQGPFDPDAIYSPPLVAEQTFRLAGAQEPEVRCPDCGALHQQVRPGKTQPTCDCEETCPAHGRNKIVYHAEGEFPRMSGYFCADCFRIKGKAQERERTYRLLKAGEIVRLGDEYDAAPSRNDPPEWHPVTNPGMAAPDPRYLTNKRYRRPTGSAAGEEEPDVRSSYRCADHAEGGYPLGCEVCSKPASHVVVAPVSEEGE